jgi:hypothetical protein
VKSRKDNSLHLEGVGGIREKEKEKKEFEDTGGAALSFIWGILALLVIFGSPAIYGIITQMFRHRERMQEKRNEELRLQLQLEQLRSEQLNVQKRPAGSDPLPKDAFWDDQVQTPYEMGYQQITRSDLTE